MKDEELETKIAEAELQLNTLREEKVRLATKRFDSLIGKYFKFSKTYQMVKSIDFVESYGEVHYSCVTIYVDDERKIYSIDANGSDSMSEEDISQEIKASEFIEAMVDCYEQIKNQVL